MLSWFKKNRKIDISQEKKAVNTPNFDDNIAKEILAQIKAQYGLDYAKQEYITMRKLERFALKNEIYDFLELKSAINSSENIKEKLINMLTVGETYFYREIGHFKILTTLMSERNITNILCAPSSSGEEVYSILIYIKENLHKNNNITITGIDINSEAIELAKSGCFSKRSISLLPLELVNKYFKMFNSRYCIDSVFKNAVFFKKQNIFDASIRSLGKFDVIFSRNMLIYFNNAQKKEAISNLRDLLNEGGVLFIGHADISFEPEGFKKIFSQDGGYFQKV